MSGKILFSRQRQSRLLSELARLWNFYNSRIHPVSTDGEFFPLSLFSQSLASAGRVSSVSALAVVDIRL